MDKRLGKGLESLIPKKNIEPSKEENLNSSANRAAPAQSEVTEEQEHTLSRTKEGISEQATVREKRHLHSREADVRQEHIFHIEIDRIAPNPHQPRREFDEASLEELADSIKEHGVIQPLIVTKAEYNVPSGTKVEYHLVAGERRWRAAKLAGLPTVPVIIRGVTEPEKLELTLVENLQREDLNPIEQGRAYQKLIEEFGLAQQAVAYRLGKSPEKISNTLRLLNLPLEVQNAIAEGKITEGHGRALLAVVGPERQRAFLREIIDKGLSVRAVEEKIKSLRAQNLRQPKSIVSLNPYYRELIDRLESVLGTKVILSPRGEGGRIAIEYYSPDELEDIIQKVLSSLEKGEETA